MIWRGVDVTDLGESGGDVNDFVLKPDELSFFDAVRAARRQVAAEFYADQLRTPDAVDARPLFDNDRIEAKYLNTFESPDYKKSHVLYGIDLVRKDIARKRAGHRRGLHRRDGLPPRLRQEFGVRVTHGPDLRTCL